MFDGVSLDWSDLGGWSAFVSLAVLVIVGFVTGRIYPRSVTEAFKSAWETERAASEKKDEAIAETLQLSRTAVATLTAIQAALQRKEEVR